MPDPRSEAMSLSNPEPPPKPATSPVEANVEHRTWSEFGSTGLLWAANSILHWFGWVLVMDVNEAGDVLDCFPARTGWRGFSEAANEQGITKLTRWMRSAVPALITEVECPETIGSETVSSGFDCFHVVVVGDLLGTSDGSTLRVTEVNDDGTLTVAPIR